jgi:hypothetical protein
MYQVSQRLRPGCLRNTAANAANNREGLREVVGFLGPPLEL